MSKTVPGNYFEDFSVGQSLIHATPRTVSTGDVALYTALYGTRFAVTSSDPYAKQLGFASAPIDDLLGFHIVFGKTVPDISLNAIANLGYADGRFHRPIYPGDTLSARSTVIGLKESSDRKKGVVYIRTEGTNQLQQPVLDYVRWVMVHKRDPEAKAADALIPDLPTSVDAKALVLLPDIDFTKSDDTLAGQKDRFRHYEPGEQIDHIDGTTLQEAEHMMATRLYQNTAKVHFDATAAKATRFGRPLIYGGHIISVARALSFNGLAHACRMAAINGGRHVAPCFAGDTIYAWTKVLDKAALPGRSDVGALRLRLIATKNIPCTHFPEADATGTYPPEVVLDFDYWAFIPT